MSWTSTRKAGLIPGVIVLAGVLLAAGYGMDTSTMASTGKQLSRERNASDEAKLRQKERTLLTDEHAVDALKGQIQSSAISADGVYVVRPGHQIRYLAHSRRRRPERQ